VLYTPEMFHSFDVADPFYSFGKVCLGIIRAVGTFYLPINPELAIGPGSGSTGGLRKAFRAAVIF